MRHAWLALVAACGSPAPAPAAVATSSDVHVDRRLELFAILEHLAGSRGYVQPHAGTYVADLERQFAPFSHHPAVAATRELARQHGVDLDKPLALALCLDDKSLALRCDPSQLSWAAGVDLAGYVASVAAFAEASHLDAFLAAHGAYFERTCSRVRVTVDAGHPRDWFDGFFGGPPGARFAIVPGLVEGGSSFSLRVQQPDGVDMVRVLGLDELDDHELPVVGPQAIDMLVHDLAHAYVDPVLARHATELEPGGAAMFALSGKPMRRLAFATWQVALREAVVRATVVQYLRDRNGAQPAADATRADQRRGFVWITEISDGLAHYARHAPNKPAGFEAYVPALAAELATLAERDANGPPPYPFVGPIDAVLDGDPATLGAADTLADHPRAAVAVYGVPGTNPTLDLVLERTHWKVGATAIELGTRKVSGAGLVLVASWPRPDDPTHGIVVHVAANAADLDGIDAAHALGGATDWMIVRRDADKHFLVAAQGDFPHAFDGAWLQAK